MHKKFGEILKPILQGLSDPNAVQQGWVTGINSYITGIFNSHISNPAWQVNGMVYVPPVEEVPLVGQFGCVNSFAFSPISAKKMKIYLNYPKGLYVGIAKAMEEMINKSILTVDLKVAGFSTPMTCKFFTSLERYGEQWQKYMDKTKCTALNQWYDTLDLFVEKMWTFVTPMIIYYTGVGGGMIFTGTVTITGQGLAS